MNLDEIREIIKTDGGKFIIVENGKPVLVITSFEDYKKRIKPLSISKEKTNPGEMDSEEANSRESNSSLSHDAPEGTPEEELTIDDLPFK